MHPYDHLDRPLITKAAVLAHSWGLVGPDTESGETTAEAVR
ncbi:hypothetical protein [Streptomyces sp. NPDC046985]